MNWRTTLILVVVFALLLGYALFVQKPKSEAVTPTPNVEYLWDIASGGVTGLRLADNANARSVAFRRDDAGQWQITEPQPAAADAVRAETIASQVETLRITRRLTETTDLSQYGVQPPAYTLEVTTTGQGTLIAHIGAKTPLGNGYYAVRPGDANAVVLSAASVDALIALIDQPPYPPTPTPEPTVTSALPGTSTPLPGNTPTP